MTTNSRLVWPVVLICLSTIGCVSSRVSQWTRHSEFDNLMPVTGDKIRARSRLQCSNLCSSESSCVSFFFAPGQDENCNLQTSILTSPLALTNSPMALYYIPTGATLVTASTTATSSTTTPTTTSTTTEISETTTPTTTPTTTETPEITTPTTTSTTTETPEITTPTTTLTTTETPETTTPTTTPTTTETFETTTPTTTPTTTETPEITTPTTTPTTTETPEITTPTTTPTTTETPETTTPTTTPTTKETPETTTPTTTPEITTPTMPATVQSGTFPSFTCPIDDSVFRTVRLTDGNLFTYRVVKTAMAYDKVECIDYGGYLARITTEEKMDVLWQLVACPGYETHNYYVDGSSRNGQKAPYDTWTTSTGDPIPMSKYFWCDTCPDSTTMPQCLCMTTETGYKWDNCNCASLLYYICESDTTVSAIADDETAK